MKKIFNLFIIIMMFFTCLTGCVSEEKKEAIANFEKEVVRIEKQIGELESFIKECEELVKTEKTALDEDSRTDLENCISDMKVAVAIELPKVEKKIEEIEKQISELKEIDLSDDKLVLDTSKKAFEKSLKQYELVYNPKESFVIERLKNIPHIKAISAVTEDNDPNGKLNKAGGYTATVYYSDDRINLDPQIYGNTVIEQGTMGGGAIEVYANEEDAIERNNYLSAFDGGILSNGSHNVIVTVVIRTSDELTASQQKEMEAKIIEALTYVE